MKMIENFFEELDIRDSSLDLALNCKNLECSHYFIPTFVNNTLRPVELSDQTVYISFATFACPNCTATYSGITLAHIVVNGEVSPIMYLQEPKLVEIFPAVVAS